MRTHEIEQTEQRIVAALAEGELVDGGVALSALLYVASSVIFNCFYEDREEVAGRFGAALADLAAVKRPLQ